jgi:hypothetical protein
MTEAASVPLRTFERTVRTVQHFFSVHAPPKDSKVVSDLFFFVNQNPSESVFSVKLLEFSLSFARQDPLRAASVPH